MDTQKVRSPIKQNVLADAGAGATRANNYLGTHTLTTYILALAKRVVCFLSLYYDYIAMTKVIDIKYSIFLSTRKKK